jgi:hypothetical protein
MINQLAGKKIPIEILNPPLGEPVSITKERARNNIRFYEIGTKYSKISFFDIKGLSQLHYSKEHEQEMKKLYESLSEKDRRRYAAVEAKKLGHGGISYICSLFLCDDKTVKKGMKELEDEASLAQCRIRRPGGGRKKLTAKMKELDRAFQEVLEGHTAGDPMDEQVKWTKLSCSEIAKGLKKRISGESQYC